MTRKKATNKIITICKYYIILYYNKKIKKEKEYIDYQI